MTGPVITINGKITTIKGGLQQKSCRVKKKTGTVTNKEKAKMWEKITLSFNPQTIEGINRDVKVLKEMWTNSKRVCDGEKLRFRQDQFVLGWIFTPRISNF
jgi:hypothetical protein